MTQKRFRNFYKSLMDKYFNIEAGTVLERSRIVICVTHGVPAHNPFLHLFEADKDLVYLDYSAVSIAEKAFTSLHMASNGESSMREELKIDGDEGIGSAMAG